MAHQRVTRGTGLLEGFLARARARRADALISSDLRGGRILDIGCGSTPYFLAHTSFKEKFAIDQSHPAEAGDIRWHALDLNRSPEIPFEDGFFAAAVERGVFHVLPREVKLKNLSELERTCSGKVILGHMTNARPYLIKRWIQSKRRSDRRIWEDAHTTYRAIDPQHNSLVKIAKLVEEVTGHPARVLYYFDGDQELSWPKPRRRMLLPYLGGVMYDTRT